MILIPGVRLFSQLQLYVKWKYLPDPKLLVGASAARFLLRRNINIIWRHQWTRFCFVSGLSVKSMKHRKRYVISIRTHNFNSQYYATSIPGSKLILSPGISLPLHYEHTTLCRLWILLIIPVRQAVLLPKNSFQEVKVWRYWRSLAQHAMHRIHYTLEIACWQ